MILITDGTKINPNQIQLNRLFSVERVLASRGFVLRKEGGGNNTIINKINWTKRDDDLVFDIFHDLRLRKELLAYIENDSPQDTISRNISDLISVNEFIRDRQRFSTTYEWYIGELLVRKFMAFSSSFGVTIDDVCRNSDGGTSGDFDVLSILGDMNLLYIECKTGKMKEKSIKNTLERSIALHCSASVIVSRDINDANLREKLLSFEHPVFGCAGNVYKINIKNRNSSTIYKWFNCYFVCASEEDGDIEIKLKAVLRIIEACRSIINMSKSPFDNSFSGRLVGVAGCSWR